MGRKSNAQKALEAAAAANEAAKTDTPEVETKTDPVLVSATPEKNPRNEMLDLLAKRTTPEPEEASKVEPEAKPEAKPEEPPVVAEAAPEAPKVIKQTVDGKEYEVPQSEIDEAGGERAWRIERASKNRLEESKAALAEAKRIKAEMDELRSNQEPPKPKQTDEQFIASKIEAIRFGTEAEAAAAFSEVIRRSNPQIDQNQVTNLALVQVRRQAAIDKFGEEFQDILANPVLGKLALTLEAEAMRQLPKNALQDPAFVGKFDWNHFYRKIGNEIRGAVGRPSQTTPAAKTTTDTPSPSSAKEERKASIVNLPAAAAKAELPKEAKEDSREDTLNQMRRSRGLLTG